MQPTMRAKAHSVVMFLAVGFVGGMVGYVAMMLMATAVCGLAERNCASLISYVR